MGCRLHVAKINKVEFADNSFFNWNVEKINTLISENCESTYLSNEDYPEGSTEVEVDNDDFKKLIEKIESMTDEEFKEYCSDIEIEELCDNYSKDYIIEGFKYILANSDPDNHYIKLHWF